MYYGYGYGFNHKGDGGIAPVNTVAPVISGTNTVGSTLSCTTGTWTGVPTPTYAYQWKRGGVNIGGATSSTYTLVSADGSTNITCTVTATNVKGSASATSNTIAIAAYDADAAAFITAASITDATQKAAVTQFYLDLKAASIYTKMKAMYLPITGSAATSKFNLVNPVDTNGAYRLTFVGGVTYASTGITFNGTTGAANTYLQGSNLTNNDTHISAYIRTNTDGVYCDLGVSAPAATYIPLIAMYARNSNSFVSRSYEYGGGNELTTANTDSRGFYVNNRVSSTGMNDWKNGVNQAGTTYSNTRDITTVTKPIYLGALNLDGTLGQYSNREYAFFSIGNGLTNTDNANLYTAVNTLMTTLGINV